MRRSAVALQVELGNWHALGAEATALRFAVFVDEQGVPADLELDEHDPVALHALARDAAGRPIATGRLLADGHIGRIAVARDRRGTGVGVAVMRVLIEAARGRGLPEVVLSAQTHALEFYRRLGFVADGGEYDDAGIPHRSMRLVL